MNGQEDGGHRDFARRDGKRKKERMEWERKCRNGRGRKEMKKSSRYLERVTQCHVKKNFSSFSFFLFFLPFDLTLSLSFLKSGYTLRAEYELCMRENVKLYNVYIRPA